MNESGDAIRSLIDEHWDDFWHLGLLTYEVQFRRLIKEERRSALVERLVELGTQAGRRVTDEPGFEFPSSDIQQARQLNATALGEVDWQETGLLRLSGYRVGKTKGKPPDERQRILNFLFLQDDLADVTDREYANSWGEPKSSKRLRKLCETLASFVRNAKRNPVDMTKAITDWETDLGHLRYSFYERWGEFPWPEVKV